MTRHDDCILLTKVDRSVGSFYEELALFMFIDVDYDSNDIDFHEYLKIPTNIVLMRKDKLDIMILAKVELIDMKSMQLVYTSSSYMELNEAGKQYYNMLCMTLDSDETDENWVDIYDIVDKYCILEVTA